MMEQDKNLRKSTKYASRIREIVSIHHIRPSKIWGGAVEQPDDVLSVVRLGSSYIMSAALMTSNQFQPSAFIE
jgi:hypothetical protein